MADSGTPPLPQGLAYGLVCGFGIVFALTMNLITWVSRRLLHESTDTNMLMTAKKSVKSGLVAAAVDSINEVSSNSVRLTYLFGFAGLWWFVAGATVQILLYAIMAIELKRRAPRANTILEALRIRFGTRTHIVYFCYGVSVQILITAALLLGGSAAFSVTTGANIIAMNYLIPFGVIVYTYLGGLKSTILSDYLHTIIIYVILFVFMFKVMAVESLPVLGSPGALWDLLQDPALMATGGAVGAKDGSYLTMQSSQALLLAGVILVSGFGSVFVDPSYGQKAIAGEPGAVVMGYFYGAFAWFSIPLGLCATMSYVAIALGNTEYWPLEGGITAYQINNAMILPLAAEAVMGKGGAVAVVLMVFMAVTSSFSAEIIAHASIVTFDIYHPYVNPIASDQRLKMVSHISLTAFALFSSTFATGLNYSGVSMGWILEFLGVILGSAVVPIILAVNSAHVSSTYMTYSAPFGSACALVSWIASAKGMFGEVSVTTLYENWPMFIGCTVGKYTLRVHDPPRRLLSQPLTSIGLFVPLIVYFAMWPLHHTPYDWEKLFLMQSLEPRPGDKVYIHDDNTDIGDDWDPSALARASRNAKIVSLVMVLIFLIIIPFSLYGTGYIFSRNFFTGWTVVVFIWSFVAAGLIWFLPLWQARETWIGVFRSIIGKGKPVTKLEGQECSDIDRENVMVSDKGENTGDEEKAVKL
ncbi:sodium symporter family protein [Seiridium cupressi]